MYVSHGLMSFHFCVLSSSVTSADPPRTFELVLVPNADGENNFVSLRMFVEYPATYPTVAPIVRIRNEKGLTESKISELQVILAEKITSSVGEVAIYTIAEGLKEYLIEHNKPELSMHEQMALRVQARDTEEEERLAKRRALEERIEAKKKEPSPLGIEPGTLLTPESFAAWRILFDAEQKVIREAKEAARGPITNKLTGKQLFQQNLAKDLEESEAEKLVQEVEPEKEKVFWFQENLYADEPDEGEEFEDLDDDDDDEDDDDDDDAVDDDMFDTTTPAQIATLTLSRPSGSSSTTVSSSSSSSSSSAAPKKPSSTSSSSSSSSSSSTSVPVKSNPVAAKPAANAKPTAATPASSSSSSSSKPQQSAPQQSKQQQPNKKDASQPKKDAPKQQQQQKGGAGGKKK